MKGFCVNCNEHLGSKKGTVEVFEQLGSNKQLKEGSVAWNYISWEVK